MKGSTTAVSWADCPARRERPLKTGCCSALPICSARQRGTGKDRCGLTSALVLGALGVSEDVIREDYLLTNETCEREAEMLCRYVLSTGKTEAEAAAAREVFLAKKEYLEAALGAIKENYGDMDTFFRDGLHLADGLIKRFRRRFCTEEFHQWADMFLASLITKRRTTRVGNAD